MYTQGGGIFTSYNLAQYLPIFEAEGYFLPEDMENLIALTVEDLVEMGIMKTGMWVCPH